MQASAACPKGGVSVACRSKSSMRASERATPRKSGSSIGAPPPAPSQRHRSFVVSLARTQHECDAYKVSACAPRPWTKLASLNIHPPRKSCALLSRSDKTHRRSLCHRVSNSPHTTIAANPSVFYFIFTYSKLQLSRSEKYERRSF